MLFLSVYILFDTFYKISKKNGYIFNNIQNSYIDSEFDKKINIDNIDRLWYIYFVKKNM